MDIVLFIDGRQADLSNLLSHLPLDVGAVLCKNADTAKKVYVQQGVTLPDVLVIAGATPTTNEPSSIEHTLDFLREMGEISRLPGRVLVLTSTHEHDSRFNEVVPAGCRLTVHCKEPILNGTVRLTELFGQK